MIVRYLLIFPIILFCFTASDPHFGNSSRNKDKLSSQVKELPWMSVNAFEKYLKDHDDRVANEFIVSDYFYPTVNFWFLIYTQFTSNHVVLHDKNNLSLIYKVLDFSQLKAQGL
jgi:hypothetical protein